MEEKQYRIVFEPDLKDYEDIVALHAKVGKGAAVKVSKGLNLVLLVVGILMFVDAAVMFWLEGRLSGYGILALAVGVFALVFFAFRRRVTALQMRRTNPKFKKRQETVIDASGLRTAADQAESRYTFGAVEAIYFWRDCYYLYLDKSLVLPLPVRGFLEGDPEQFGSDLSEQCGLPVQTPSDKNHKER